MKTIRIVGAVAVIVWLTTSSAAQLDRAGLNGTVTDSSGRVLPQARIVAVHNTSGLRRETTSSSAGAYDLPELPVGVYTVTFAHDGFKPLSFQNVVQAVNQTRTLNAILLVSGGQQQIEVSASSVQLDETSSTLGTRIEQKQIKELPLNGRNWATLTALAPGAVDTGGSNQRSVRFAGRGRDDNNFTYDGIDATNVINQAQQPYVRLAIPLETIQEFRVDAMLATAETGGSGGGQLIVTSASGTNSLHGNAFEFSRNNVFDARQPIDNLNPTQPPFHLNQFGASLGGPIVKDKTFFFVAYEGYRQILGQTLPGFVPSDAFRAQVLAESPVLTPIVNAYPHGQVLIGPDIAQFVGEGRQVIHENSGMFRLDHRFSERTTLFVRANIDSALSNAPFGSSGSFLEDTQELTSSPVNAGIELLHIFSPTLLNEVKFGFNRSTADTTDINHTNLLYAVAVSGFTTLNNNRASIGAGNTFSGIDNVTWVEGRHTIKAGIEIRRVQMNQGTGSSGTLSFPSTDAFAANQLSTANLTAALPVNGLRKTQYFGYVQDEFKWLPNLTLNLGARYSFFNIFHEVQGRSNPFDFDTCGPQGFCGVGVGFGQPNYGDLDPRIAFAYDPRRNGHTVLRAGFGIYHEDGQLDDQNLPNSNEVFRYSLSSKTIPDLSFPIDSFLVDTTGKISPRAEDRRRKDTYVDQWSFSVQQTLPGDFVGTISYVGSAGHHLLTLSEVNVVDPATGLRPYPQFGQVDWRGNRSNSNYNGLSIAVRRSFSHGFLFGANYMWSHEIDDGSNGSGDGDSLVAQNVACHSCERADGAFDVRHDVTANLVYELPFGAGKPYLNQPGAVRGIFGAWELFSIVDAHTGFPVDVIIDRNSADVPDGNTNNQRPDIVPGVSLIPPGGQTISEWINPAAFSIPLPGTFGDAPRNVARARGTWQFDAGLGKHIPLNERMQLEFRAEVFNIFNHPQYGAPLSDLSAGPGIFGSIISAVNTGPVGTGTPRQIQLALRFAF
ncbi:MAG: TonB-dependent receptor domain-containing protein [Terriglobales bacterium]